MSLPNDIQWELEQLLAKAVDDSLSAEQARRLERLVLGHPERLRFMRDYMQLEVQLQAEATVAQGVPPAYCHVANTAPPATARPQIRRSLAYAAVLGGLAAAVCLAAGYAPQLRHHTDHPTGVEYRVGDPTVIGDRAE